MFNLYTSKTVNFTNHLTFSHFLLLIYFALNKTTGLNEYFVILVLLLQNLKPQNLMDFRAVKKHFYGYTLDREGQI